MSRYNLILFLTICASLMSCRGKDSEQQNVCFPNQQAYEIEFVDFFIELPPEYQEVDQVYYDEIFQDLELVTAPNEHPIPVVDGSVLISYSVIDPFFYDYPIRLEPGKSEIIFTLYEGDNYSPGEPVAQEAVKITEIKEVCR